MVDIGSEITEFRVGYINKIHKVQRVTKKLIILENGTRLKYDSNSHSKSKLREYGNDNWRYEYVVTTENHHSILEKLKKERMIENWFKTTTFTAEQKEMFYNLLNK